MLIDWTTEKLFHHPRSIICQPLVGDLGMMLLPIRMCAIDDCESSENISDLCVVRNLLRSDCVMLHND